MLFVEAGWGEGVWGRLSLLDSTAVSFLCLTSTQHLLYTVTRGSSSPHLTLSPWRAELGLLIMSSVLGAVPSTQKPLVD